MKQYPLEARTKEFSKDLIRFCKSLPRDIVINPINSQLIRSGTSIGANYCEANNASSKSDFRNKIFISKKEAQETLYWLDLLLDACSQEADNINQLRDECMQFIRIFQKITSTLK